MIGSVLVKLTEGTTTNGDFLLPFKTGAFLARTPVLPVILKYPYQRFSPAWDTISGVRICCYDFQTDELCCGKIDGSIEHVWGFTFLCCLRTFCLIIIDFQLVIFHSWCSKCNIEEILVHIDILIFL